jgi:hypothetical protein
MDAVKAKGRISVRRMQMKLLELTCANFFTVRRRSMVRVATPNQAAISSSVHRAMPLWAYGWASKLWAKTDQVSHQVNLTQLLFAMPRAALPEMAPEFEPERKLLRAAENIDTSDN